MRRFHVVRQGKVVADGELHDEPWDVDLPTDGPRGRRRGVYLGAGWVLVRWHGEYRSTVLWPSYADAVAVHGHDGTTFIWLDGGEADA